MRARTTAFVPIFGPWAGDVNLYEGFPLLYNKSAAGMAAALGQAAQACPGGQYTAAIPINQNFYSEVEI